jgi:hypothetical protein
MTDSTPTRLRISDLADLLAGFRDFAEPIDRDSASLADEINALVRASG